MSEGRPPRVVVLGGGSAGWITACLLHREWAAFGGTVTVIESPEIGIIGVGEGSTPQLKAFFDHLGIAESEWMGACDATYKLGIRFHGWSERPGFGTYFHPFPGPVDLHTEPGFVHNCALARRGEGAAVHPDAWYLAARLAGERKGPHAADSFPFAPSYGYHFDAYKLGAFLRDWATARGVVHRPLTIAGVDRDADGTVAALLADGGERIEGDLFVDCSGFRALLAEGVAGAGHVSFAENLVNDRAVVLATPPDEARRPQTDAHAMAAGWRWAIPLSSRTGNGYVYSSRYLSDDEAEAELRAALGTAEGEARVLRFKTGRVENTWNGNCLSAGLAQGFLEPLEATALHIVIVTALEFAQCYRQGRFTAKHRDAFNASIAARYDGIRDYIVAHYRLNRRTDTAYWRDMAASDALSQGLKRMMTAWFRHQDMLTANDAVYGGKRYYPNLSWHCLFAGYGTFPESQAAAPPAAARFEPPSRLLAACAQNFAPLADGLNGAR